MVPTRKARGTCTAFGWCDDMPYLWMVAEVMDKEPPLARVWLFAIGAAVVMFVLALIGKRSVVAVGPLSLLLAYATVSETWDPYVGPAIIEEAGHAYVVQCHLAAGLIVVGAITGAVMAFRRHSASLPNKAAAGDGGPQPLSTGARRA